MSNSTDMGEERVFTLVGPLALRLTAVHKLGPFAARYGRELELPSVSFTLKNTGQKPITLHALDVDPLQRKSDGAGLITDLSIQPEAGSAFPVCLQPHDIRGFRLSGSGRLPPGSYQSCLRITSAGIDGTYRIPIAVNVKSHWSWAMGFMFLGLAVTRRSGWLDVGYAALTRPSTTGKR